MVALLPPYVETAPQLCQFEGSEIDDVWSKHDGVGVKHRNTTAHNIFLICSEFEGTPFIRCFKFYLT